MNYRHAFHAGNFADVFKHAALVQALIALTRSRAPLTVIDTHAGAGVYDLMGEQALKSGEAKAGISRLLADPAAPLVFEPYLRQVRAHPAYAYPGSPVLIAARLRPGDRLVACELNGKDHAPLAAALKPYVAQARLADGFLAAQEAAGHKGPLFVHIDPPYETGADYGAAADTAALLCARNPDATVMIWAPLKDLDTFDRFLTRLERLPRALVAELRLRPLNDPMRMNGCALVLAGAWPPDLLAPLEAITAWCAQNLGESGARGRVFELS